MSQRDSTFHRGLIQLGFQWAVIARLNGRSGASVRASRLKNSNCALVSLSALDPRRQRIGEIF